MQDWSLIPDHLLARAQQRRESLQGRVPQPVTPLPPVHGAGNLNDAVACVGVALDNLNEAAKLLPVGLLDERGSLARARAETESLLGRLLVRQRTEDEQ